MDPSALGRYLRESREAKELTLEDAVTALRIRRPILESFEQGDFTKVETPVQMRGLLRNYARFLDLEEERVLQYYEAAMNPRRRRGRFGRRKKRDSELLAPRRITDTPPSLPAVPDTITQPRRERTARIARGNSLLNVFWILGGCVLFGFIVYVIVTTIDIWPTSDDAPDAAVANTEAQPNQTMTMTATFIPTSTTIAPTSANLDFASQGFVGLSVRMEMTQRAWVRIVADDIEQFAEVLEPDEVIEFEANDTVQIITANAIAVRLIVNGITQPTFGRRGQQAEVNISTSGISITLEGEPTSTPTETPAPATNTPEPLPTLDIPTNTPTAVQVNSIGQTPDTENAVTSQPTIAPPTPTSIFDEPAQVVTDEPTEAPAIGNANTAAQSSAAVDTTSQDAATSEPEPTATLIPPTASGAVLPLRATPANPTPTKSG